MEDLRIGSHEPKIASSGVIAESVCNTTLKRLANYNGMYIATEIHTQMRNVHISYMFKKKIQHT